MTNPNAALRMLLTYGICIPIAIIVGWMLTNPLDYSTLGFLGLLIALLLSPIFIKWHYPMLVFGLGFPAQMFFLKGNPPCWEVVAILSLTLAIVERTLNSNMRFLKAPAMTWALLYTAFMAVITMELTGGFGLHTLGGEVGGGRKYIELFIGIGCFFALTSRAIPPEKRNLYIGLYYLSGAFAAIGDLFPALPSPLNYINMVFPPSQFTANAANFGGIGFTRLEKVTSAAYMLATYLLARHGLKGLLNSAHLFRLGLFAVACMLMLLGGSRSALSSFIVLVAFLFVLEGLHRTAWMGIVLAVALVTTAVVIPFSQHLPYTFQRSLAFLPLEFDPAVRADAEGTAQWRYHIWEAMWPKVPEYLLLGKGYSLTAEDYQGMGQDNPFAASAKFDASMEGLAISNDFHNGPLSTLICFGLWGALAMLVCMLAGIHILWRNFKFGDPDLRIINGFLLVSSLQHIFVYFFVLGAFSGDILRVATTVGFGVALNGGVCHPKPKTAFNPSIKPVPAAA